MNDGGLGLSIGKSLSGLPMILCFMQNFSGNSPITERTFLATGLYFFLVDRKSMTEYLESHKQINRCERV
jgi:hypothetical protein